MVIDKWTRIICARVEAKWASHSQIKGQKEIDQFTAVVGNTIVGTIRASGMAAWIEEFGSGHLLDRDNPYLEAYKRSPMWNKEREYEGNEWVGREAGATVYRPDGSTDTSSGKAHVQVNRMNNASYREDGASGQYGLHMEHDLNRSGNNPGYKAIEPMHVIKFEVEAAMPDMLEDIGNAVAQDILELIPLKIDIYV
jgi:hypothetical protein